MTISKAVLVVLLQKDMSLNRRIHAWYLGTSHDLDKFSKDIILVSLKDLLHSPSEKDEFISQPFKILVSLMDKSEISTPVISDIMADILVSIKKKHESVSPEIGAEILQSANIFFELVELPLVWGSLLTYMDSVFLSNLDNISDLPDLITFATKELKIRDEEAMRMHMPLFFVGIIEQITKCDKVEQGQIVNFQLCVGRLLEIAIEMLGQIPQSCLSKETNTSIKFPATSPEDRKQFMQNIFDYYKTFDKYDVSAFADITFSVVQQSLQRIVIFMEHFNKNYLFAEQSSSREEHLLQFKQTYGRVMNIFTLLAAYDDSPNRQATRELISVNPVFINRVKMWKTTLLHLDYIFIMVKAVNVLSKNDCLADSNHFEEILYTDVIFKVWEYFVRIYSSAHYKASKVFWMLWDTSDPSKTEDFVSNRLYLEADFASEVIKFTHFWKTSDSLQYDTRAFVKPLFFVLDGVKSENSIMSRCCVDWLRYAVTEFDRVLDPLLDISLDERIIKSATTNAPVYRNHFNCDKVRFSFQMLFFLMKYAKFNFFKYLGVKAVSNDLVQRASTKISVREDSVYGDVVFQLLIYFFNIEAKEGFSVEECIEIDFIQKYATKCILFAIENRSTIPMGSVFAIKDDIISKLYFCTENRQLEKITDLLQLLKYSMLSLDMKMIEREPVKSLMPLFSFIVEFETESEIIHTWIDFTIFMCSFIDSSRTLVLIPLFNEFIKRMFLYSESLKQFAESKSSKITVTGENISVAFSGMSRFALNIIPDREVPEEKDRRSSKIKTRDFSKKDISNIVFVDMLQSILSFYDLLHINTSMVRGDSETYDLLRETIFAKIGKQMERLGKANPEVAVEALLRVWAISSNNKQNYILKMFECFRWSPSDILSIVLNLFRTIGVSGVKDPAQSIMVWNTL